MKQSIIPLDDPDSCYVCGRVGPTEIHHCLHGSGRRPLADRYGLTVHLCRECHRNLHDKGIMDRELERLAQNAFEKEHSHEEWMRIFGKDYTA